MKSAGTVFFDNRRGGFENACIPLDRLLGESIGASPDNLGALSGLGVGFNEGRRAFRSRSPMFLALLVFPDCPAWLPRLVGRRLGDLLSARSRTSGCDLARLDLVGDWKDGRPGERAPSRDANDCGARTAASGASLILRRFGGEFIFVITFHRLNSRQPAESHKQRAVCSVCIYDLILPAPRPTRRDSIDLPYSHRTRWSVSPRAGTRSGGQGFIPGLSRIAFCQPLLPIRNMPYLRLLGA